MYTHTHTNIYILLLLIAFNFVVQNEVASKWSEYLVIYSAKAIKSFLYIYLNSSNQP